MLRSTIVGAKYRVGGALRASLLGGIFNGRADVMIALCYKHWASPRTDAAANLLHPLERAPVYPSYAGRFLADTLSYPAILGRGQRPQRRRNAVLGGDAMSRGLQFLVLGDCGCGSIPR